MKTVYVGEPGSDEVSVPKTVVHSLADWWPLPPAAGGTVTREEYLAGLRPGRCSLSTDARLQDNGVPPMQLGGERGASECPAYGLGVVRAVQESVACGSRP